MLAKSRGQTWKKEYIFSNVYCLRPGPSSCYLQGQREPTVEAEISQPVRLESMGCHQKTGSPGLGSTARVEARAWGLKDG